MKKIYAIPFEHHFIATYAEAFLGNTAGDLSRTAVVFPGRRAFLYLNRILAGMKKGSFLPPAELLLTDFIAHIAHVHYPGLMPLSRFDALWMLFGIVKDLGLPLSGAGSKKAEFGDMFPWLAKVLEFIELADSEDVGEERLRNLKANAEIGYDVPASVNLILARLIPIRQKFHEEMMKNGRCTRGLLYRLASGRIAGTNLPGFDKIHFCGLFGLTGVEKRIVKELFDSGKAEIIWHGRPEEWPCVLQPLLKYFQAETSYIEGKERPEGTDLKVFSAADIHSEVLGVRRLLHEEKTGETVVVLPLADTLFPFLSFGLEGLNATGKNRDFNITMGYPLDRTALYSLVHLIIKAQRSIRGKKNNGVFRYDAVQYSDILSNPFIKNLGDEVIRTFCLEACRALKGEIKASRLRNASFILLEEVVADSALMQAVLEAHPTRAEQQVRQAVAELHDRLFVRFEAIGTLDDLCGEVESLLEYILDRSKTGSYVLSGEVFNCFFNAISEMKGTEMGRQPLAREWLLDLFLYGLTQASVSFDTRPLEDLEIMGMLETRNLNFRTVVMLDVQEGIMPGEKEIDPLVPAGLYDVLGLPGHEQKQEMYRYYFMRLIRGARSARLFYVQDDKSRRSRFIEEMIWEREKREKRLGALAVRKVHFPVRLVSRFADEIVIAKSPVLLRKLEEMSYSPSALDDYLGCRLRFYFSRVLKLREQAEKSEGVDPRERGNLIHGILHDTFRPFLGKELTESRFPEVEAELKKAVERCFSRQPRTGEYYLFRKIAETHLSAFLKKDLGRGPFKIVYLEKEWEAPFSANGRDILLCGRIDRVDGRDGSFIIGDYKTGKVPGEPKIILPSGLKDAESIREHLFSFQLPVYLFLARSAKPDWALERTNARFVPLLNGKGHALFPDEAGDGSSRREIFEDFYLKALSLVLCEILDPGVPFRKYKNTDCRDCPFTRLCGTEEQKEEREY